MSMNRRPSPCALALAIATLLPLGNTLAQEQGATAPQAASTEQKPATLDTVTVTAQRRVEDVQDVPMAITTVDGEKLEVLVSGGEDVRLLSGRLPSLNIESSFGRAFPRFYIRGLGNTDFDLNASQPVSLVYDDVVQENPILKGFPMFDMAQVEMYRGPQGTLFGRNSPAGVIKFSSARPEEVFGGYGKISYGSYGTMNLEGAITGPLAKGVSARLSVLHQRRDDWVDNVNNGPGDDLEGYEETAARLQVLFAPSDDFEALANVHMRKLDGTARLFRANIIQPGTNDFVPGYERDKIYIDGTNVQDLDQVGANLRMRWDFGRTTLHSITGYESVEVFSRGDIDGGSVYTFDFFTGDGADIGPPLTGARFNAQSADGLPEHRQLSQEFRLESNEWGRFDWQAGLFWFDEEIDVDTFNYDDFAPGQPQNGHASQQQDNTAWAVFASADFDVTDRFILRGGLRYTRDEKDFTAARDQPTPFNPPVIAPISISTADSDISWDLSAVYELSEATNLYTRVAKGFRAPSIQGRLLFADLIFTPATGADYVTVADTETVISWEAGIKTQVWDNRLRMGLAVFHYQVDDQQLTAVGGDANIARLVNADRMVGQGAEFDLEAFLTPNLLVTFGASYNDTEIQDSDLSVFPCAACTVLDPADPNRPGAVLIDGNSLPQAPKHVYNVTARYGVPVGNGEFFAFTDWAYRSEVNFFLYDSVEFIGKSKVEGGLRLGYNWSNGAYEVAVFGRNITDEDVIVAGIDFNNLTGMVNEPRTWGAQFTAKF
ncbi:TonB-dependent receptor [Lysobacter sp. CFH 32150]|uniref:TonB-dependent receptor n=1 Tax=Lysobacter sp. CFH 32150 TaxID=2927128 RepID=UPI001FA780A3|nr:TonB-dependent receptor [Lysobacter sp. CFH 32150]MCI4568037.1 TonB-dependent receptor [Lysobacter sp. CFH 32150]